MESEGLAGVKGFLTFAMAADISAIRFGVPGRTIFDAKLAGGVRRTELIHF